jgi:hypothetical protein
MQNFETLVAQRGNKAKDLELSAALCKSMVWLDGRFSLIDLYCAANDPSVIPAEAGI